MLQPGFNPRENIVRASFTKILFKYNTVIIIIQSIKIQSHLFNYLVTIIWQYFPEITEPNAPPTNVNGHNTSSTSILVEWGNVPTADQNGVILSHTVTYKALPDGSQRTKTVSGPTTQAILTGLNEFAKYSITVFASTVKGGGRESAPIIVITDEDSKLKKHSIHDLK